MITDKHRCFYVNGKLEFALWYDSAIVDKEKIIKDFLESRDFKFLADYCGWKVKKTEISDDLKRVDITVKVPEEKPLKDSKPDPVPSEES